jgi:lipoate---protein ligase
MGLRSFCILSPHTEAAFNLAIEEQLLEAGRPDERYFLLYGNGPSVIIGRNQDALSEVAPAVLAAGFPPVYRRISGGGTVYHDLGNLNFCFIGPEQAVEREAGLGLIRRALLDLGIPAEATDKGDLYLSGRKISGTARCLKHRRLLHHGTLLVATDLAELRRVLAPAGGFAPAGRRAVASRPAPVMNLAAHAAGLTPARLKAGLFETMLAAWPACSLLDWRAAAGESDVAARAARYRSREWTFPPQFETTGPVAAAGGAPA